MDGSSSRSDPKEPVCTAWCHPPLPQRHGPAILLARRIASLVLVGQTPPRLTRPRGGRKVNGGWQEQAHLAPTLPRLAQRHSLTRYLWPDVCSTQSSAFSTVLPGLDPSGGAADPRDPYPSILKSEGLPTIRWFPDDMNYPQAGGTQPHAVGGMRGVTSSHARRLHARRL